MTRFDTIYCLDDTGGWGKQLYMQALKRRFKAVMVTAETAGKIPPKSLVFMRIAQDKFRGCSEKIVADGLAHRDCTLIPDSMGIVGYEDKWQQVEWYRKWMPRTLTLTSAYSARVLMNDLGYPFVSKSKTGSASANVRLVRDSVEAENEINEVFGTGRKGLHKLGEDAQRGYLIWQEFLPNNAYDYRVVITGEKMMALRRFNKPGTPFASGSGVNEPVIEITDEVHQVLVTAGAFFNEFKMKWCGIDLVKNQTGQWKILETTLGWSLKAYLNAPYFGTKYVGGDMFEVLVNEIERGVFDK